MEYRKYDIIKNCFAGRKGYELTLNPDSQKAKRLLDNGFIKEHGNKPKQKKPDAEKRETKVTEPKETKRKGKAKK